MKATIKTMVILVAQMTALMSSTALAIDLSEVEGPYQTVQNSSDVFLITVTKVAENKISLFVDLRLFNLELGRQYRLAPEQKVKDYILRLKMECAQNYTITLTCDNTKPSGSGVVCKGRHKQSSENFNSKTDVQAIFDNAGVVMSYSGLPSIECFSPARTFQFVNIIK